MQDFIFTDILKVRACIIISYKFPPSRFAPSRALFFLKIGCFIVLIEETNLCCFFSPPFLPFSLQLNEEEKVPFKQLLHALQCGAPPHGGIALGKFALPFFAPLALTAFGPSFRPCLFRV